MTLNACLFVDADWCAPLNIGAKHSRWRPTISAK